MALFSVEQVEVVANGFAFTEGPQWVHDEEVGHPLLPIPTARTKDTGMIPLLLLCSEM